MKWSKNNFNFDWFPYFSWILIHFLYFNWHFKSKWIKINQKWIQINHIFFKIWQIQLQLDGNPIYLSDLNPTDFDIQFWTTIFPNHRRFNLLALISLSLLITVGNLLKVKKNWTWQDFCFNCIECFLSQNKLSILT